MQIFVYDRSFEGLLSVVFDAFTLKIFPHELYGPDDVLPFSATQVHRVELKPEKPARVFAALKKKLSPFMLRAMLYAWMSEQPGSDAAIYRFICKVLRADKSIENDMADADVWEVVRLHRKVSKELHRFTGFVRFQKSKEGMYFSAIAPKYNVLPLLLRHFSERLWDQQWIIYDLVRHYGIKYEPGRSQGSAPAAAPFTKCVQKHGQAHNQGHFEEVFMDEKRLRDGFLREEYLADGELLLEALWRTYYDTASIKERQNLRLQRNFMPKRFWKYLTEKRPQGPQEPDQAELM